MIIIVNHVQTLTIIGEMRLEWPLLAKQIMAALSLQAMRIPGANPECITMSLFAPDHGKNSPYSLETGGWSNKVRIFPGDYRQEVGPNDHWHSVRIEATADGEVRYSLDDVVVYTVTDTSLQSGTVQFIAGCVPMVVRNVVVVTSADHVGYTAAPHCSDGFAPILQADECARAAEELG